MKKLALLALMCGMGFLVAQEPGNTPDKKPPTKEEGGRRPFGPKGGDKGKFGPISYKKLLETHDKDKDGVLSKDELSGGRNMWERWQKADVNMDNKLDEKEFNDYQKNLMERFKGGKRGEDRKKD
jgi:hypothetical protein